ncbi:MAG: hypothetical protein P1U46_00670 [Patescibacteria group bacterium]|nr:hypothetical protein [Patescibacteria group bacterium]
MTVAPKFIKSEITGFHTILLLHITVTVFHSSFISSLFNISIIHAGVHGIKPFSSPDNTFHTLFG